MPNDTVYITILREPTELFESLYSFVGMEKVMQNVLYDEMIYNSNSNYISIENSINFSYDALYLQRKFN